MNIKHKIAKFFVTVCYIGKIKYCPGTFGSLPAFPLCYVIMHLTFINNISFQISGFNTAENQIISLFIIELLATLFLFLMGIYFAAIYIKNSSDKDPKEVVIDEVVGQMLTIIFCSFSVIMIFGSNIAEKFDARIIDFLLLFLSPFIFFRLFDIMKPWPINWFDQNIKGAFGIMLDDVIAAIFAIVVHYVFIFTAISFFSK